MFDKFEKDLSSKGNLDNISPQLENLKKENEKLREENGNLNNKIKSLENELKKKSEKTELKPSSSLSSSRISQKKYKCRLLCKKDNIFHYTNLKNHLVMKKSSFIYAKKFLLRKNIIRYVVIGKRIMKIR